MLSHPKSAHRTMVLLAVLTISLLQAANATLVYAPVINRFGQSGLVYSQSAKTLGMGRLVINANAAYSGDRHYVYAVDTDTADNHAFTAINFLPSVGYGITNFLDFAVTMPVYWDQYKQLGSMQGGFGDLELTGKFQYPPYPHNRMFEVAFFGALSLPTGNLSDGYFPRHSYYQTHPTDSTVDVKGLWSSGTPEMDLKMLWTLDLHQLNKASPILLHVNFGARFVFDAAMENIFLLNLAFEYRPVPVLVLFTEFSGETRMDNVKSGFKLGDDPLRLSPGISITPPGGFFITLSADIGLCADTTYLSYSLDDKPVTTKIDERWRLNASIGWAGFVLPQDSDRDGLKDNVDRCPNAAEDFDGFQDADGCPDLDNDNDGVPDVKDKCPNDPEDLDGFKDADGCPDPDNDKDGLLDLKDQCPNVAEDLDGSQDADGCPDYDNDNDGIPDSVDQCMNQPEDRDGFKDNDGCPDLDNDEDGVPDSLDKCPDTKGVPENFGCPSEKPAKPKEIKRGRVVLRGVNYEFGSAVLTGDSYAILEEVFESLREWPEVKIEIRGHTDSVGSNDANKQLSQKRAESVMNYLVARGIDAARLSAVGYGEDDPIADNKTVEGRAENRRVELRRVD